MSLKDRKLASEKLRLENKKMEMRLQQLKVTMTKEKEERMINGNGSIWNSGAPDGGILNYKRNLSGIDPNRKLKVRMLKEEPLVEDIVRIPKRIETDCNVSGDVDNSFEISLESTRKVEKSIKCGQCEQTKAAVNCKECSEYYCPKCFAAFHLKGALRKHRSTPISATNTRVSIPSPLFKLPPGGIESIIESERDKLKTPKTKVNFKSPRNKENHNVQTSKVGVEKLDENVSFSSRNGEFNEEFSHQYFREALDAWRKGEDVPSSPTVGVKPKSAPNMTEHSTQSNNILTEKKETPSVIEFNPSMTYAEQLLLRKYRNQHIAPIEMKYILSRLSKNNEHEMAENKKIMQNTIDLESSLIKSKEADKTVIDQNKHLDLSVLTDLWTEADRLMSQLPNEQHYTKEKESFRQLPQPNMDYKFGQPPPKKIGLSEEEVEKKILEYTNKIPRTVDSNVECENEQNQQIPYYNNSSQRPSKSESQKRTNSARQRFSFNDRPHSSRKMSARKETGGNLTTTASAHLNILADFSNYLNDDVNKESTKPPRPNSSVSIKNHQKLSYSFYKTSPKLWKPTHVWSTNNDSLIDECFVSQLENNISENDIELEDEIEKLNALTKKFLFNDVGYHNISLSISNESDNRLANADVDLCDNEGDQENMEEEMNRLQEELSQISHRSSNSNDQEEILIDSLEVTNSNQNNEEDLRLWNEDDKYRIEDSLDFMNRNTNSSSTPKDDDGNNSVNEDDMLSSSRFDDYNDVYNLR